MRTPDRLFEVVDTLNINAVGMSAASLKIAATQLRRDGKASPMIRDEVEIEAFAHPSPHVRELAAKLLALMGDQG